MDRTQSSYQSPETQQAIRLRQLLIQERWPEMARGCRACINWSDLKRPESCGACGIGERRLQQER
ncbi:MAG: hypothetical protein HC921_14895 [Synechococcaceae cyanobacterium SM2_3_1]|nr:hypothetical protein [Synechococcaceae cyanobacterium SM2_3_1]